MPRNVRNFWIEAQTFEGVGDKPGRTVKFGPRTKFGTFDQTVLMRDKGETVEAVSLLGRLTEENGRVVLRLTVRGPKGEQVLSIETER